MRPRAGAISHIDRIGKALQWQRLGQQLARVDGNRRRHLCSNDKATDAHSLLKRDRHPITVAKSSGRCKGNNGKSGATIVAAQPFRIAMFQLAKSVDDAIAPIGDGCMLVVPREVSGVPMEATRALVRRGIKQLHLVALPTSSLQADLLIGAGCVETLETSAVSLGEFGAAPRFTAAILGGAIRMKDATCPALHASFQASEKGVPFMPLRGLLGTDVLKNRPDWKVVDNPFESKDP